ncbi:MAG: DUF1800 domain-containing protein [Methylovulum sp.]|nr:DUF1800 domain-containing protein [Methylovulum sp.]
MIKLLQTIGLLCCLPALVLAAPLSGEDVRWLNRVTYGINSETLDRYAVQGRATYLNRQLQNTVDDHLPARVADLIAAMRISVEPVKMEMLAMQENNRKIDQLPLEQRQQAKMEANQPIGQMMMEVMHRHLFRAVYSPAQIKEQMVWFWFNHFNVSRDKSPVVKMLLADYEERAIRPYALGKFRDLLMATLHHPAMLVYLDNTQNAVNKVNENYARELMELHTLGVAGGYSQQDVQALAHILTGVGMNWTDNFPKLSPKMAAYYRHLDGFEFNPNRHDFSDKVFLGKTIKGDGFAEVEQAVDMLVRHPSTARFISQKLATYWVADTPSPELVANMAKMFQATNGDIAAVLRVLFESKAFADSLGGKVKDPFQYVVSALRFAYEDRPLTSMKPPVNWLNELGEPLFGRLTPDGFGLTAKDWLSPGQLTRRFEIAQRIGGGKTPLFGADVDPKTLTAPVLANRLYYLAIEPYLSVQTKNALAKAVSQTEWDTFLLSSPEFMYH